MKLVIPKLGLWFALVSLCDLSVSIAQDTSLSPKGSISPLGSYWFTSVQREAYRDLVLKSKNWPEFSYVIGLADKSDGSIIWSDDEKFFCKIVHPVAHITYVQVYRILIDKKNNLIDHVELIYTSPQPDRYDQCWSFVKWNLKKGTAVLHCSYAVDDTDVSHRRWSECDVEILIDYCYRQSKGDSKK